MIRKTIKGIAITLLVTIIGLTLITIVYMQKATFGKTPTGKRLEKIKQSPNYRDGKFQNLSFTPDLAEGASYYKVMKDFFFEKDKRNIPGDIIPTQKTDLKALPKGENILVWFGHSSYFMQVDGKAILVDPVLSGNASPVKFTTKAFKGSDAYSTDDFPDIDYLFLSHDHYDHMDHETLVKLRPKIRRIITGLGVGAHLEQWGFDMSTVSEHDWNEQVDLEGGFTVHTTPGRHFSGRGLKRNQSLWMSYVLQTPSMRLFIGGDSGYDTHFAKIGEQYGPFDLAILECGQYNAYWRYIHMMPEETVQAAIDLKARKLLPVHWGKFALSLHAWDESIIRAVAEADKKGMPLIHPMIGQAVNLNADTTYTKWWETVK